MIGKPVTAAQWRERLKAEYTARLASWSDIRAQMPLLLAAVRRYEKPVIAELGTRTGQSTIALLAGAAETGGHVWSVDSGETGVPSWWKDTGFWDFLAADDMSARAREWVPAVLDILFIDTGHLYEATLTELGEYVPRVRPGGTVLCHDTELICTDPVMGEAWIRRAAGGPPHPVAAALDAYCAETSLTWGRQPVPAVVPEDEPFYGLGTILIP